MMKNAMMPQKREKSKKLSLESKPIVKEKVKYAKKQLTNMNLFLHCQLPKQIEICTESSKKKLFEKGESNNKQNLETFTTYSGKLS